MMEEKEDNSNKSENGQKKSSKKSISDSNASFLRAARAGNLEKVLDFLKNGTDINTCNNSGLNALHLAAKEGHVNVVTELLSRKIDIDAATKKGNTALHIASLAGQEEIVQILVQNYVKINVQSQNGFTPLYMAAQENHSGVVKFLLANGASQTLATEDGFTPLAVALQQGHDKVVKVLLENDSRGKIRLPALHIAAKKDDCSAAALLLKNDEASLSKGGTLVNDVTKSGFTPLHIASHYGNVNVARLLIDKGADVNYKARNQITPLHVASKWNKPNMVQVLLDNGADISSNTKDNLTPLHCAARSGHDSVVEMLLEKNAPVTAQSRNYLTPLHMAAQGNHYDSARLLIHYGPKKCLEDVTVDYLTPLHVAAHCGSYETAKLLLECSCKVDARARNGFTSLHIACKKNRYKIVELLLKYGARIDATTETGLTPLHVASWCGYGDISVFLIQHGADPNAKMKRGESPLHMAVRASQIECARILLRNGANVDARANHDETPLHIAAKIGDADMVACLLQNSATADAVTKDEHTALHIASKEGHDEVVSVLLAHNTNMDARTRRGFTPLHLAAKKGNTTVARMLLERGAKPDVEGKHNLTPLHVAAHYNKVDVALLLLQSGASPHCKARNGMTPLHIASKKDEMTLANTLLQHDANANAETKNGYTPLHYAALEGNKDVAALLIENGADVNAASHNGLRPLHLCAQEDYVSVAEILVRNNAEIDPKTKAGYTPLHVACHFGQINMIKFLLEKHANIHSRTKIGYTPLHQGAQQGHVLVINHLLKYGAESDANVLTESGQTPLSIAQKLGYISVVEALKKYTNVSASVSQDKYEHVLPETMDDTAMSDTDLDDDDMEQTSITNQDMKYMYDNTISPTKEDNIIANVAQMDYTTMDDSRYMSMSYPSFGSGFDPDNIVVDKHPNIAGKLKWKSFLVSFMVDALGGAMKGCRHSGVRLIIPPGRATIPTRIICKLVKKEKLTHPPSIMENEGLATRILEMGPCGAQFNGEIILEVPHYASLRDGEREIVVMRSDNGETWKEHTVDNSDEAVTKALNGSFEDLDSAEDIYKKRVARIVTPDLPKYFAIISRVKQETKTIGPDGEILSAQAVPQVQAVFPQGSLTKKIKVGLQAQPISDELVQRMCGSNRIATSPIVTVEPRRRKFHEPITLTIPLPKGQKGMINQGQESPSLRLLCSISGGNSPAHWEDITGTTLLTYIKNCVKFETKVSARFWLIDCQNTEAAPSIANDIYKSAISVPYMANYIVYAKRHDPLEGRLRVFCITDDKLDKTLEAQENFVEVARSKDVEVMDSKKAFIEMAGNLCPITKSGEQLYLNFKAFRENRLPFTVRIKDIQQIPVACIAFMKDPKSAKIDEPTKPICNLKFELPGMEVGGRDLPLEISARDIISVHHSDLESAAATAGTEESISRADLRLTDIAECLRDDWEALARYFGVGDDQINRIKEEYEFPSERGLVFLHVWIQQFGPSATGNDLEMALKAIHREDVIHECMTNIEKVVDEGEKEVARSQIENSAAAKKLQASYAMRNMSLDVAVDDQDLQRDVDSDFGRESDGRGRMSSVTEEEFRQDIDHDKSETSENYFDEFSNQKKMEAYGYFSENMQDVNVDTLTAGDRTETIVREDVITPSHDERLIDDAIFKTEVKQDESMDDRLSISSGDSLTMTKPLAVSSIVGEKKKAESEVKQEVVDVVVKTESRKEESMDDRLSLSSDESLTAKRPTELQTTQTTIVKRTDSPEFETVEEWNGTEWVLVKREIFRMNTTETTVVEDQISADQAPTAENISSYTSYQSEKSPEVLDKQEIKEKEEKDNKPPSTTFETSNQLTESVSVGEPKIVLKEPVVEHFDETLSDGTRIKRDVRTIVHVKEIIIKTIIQEKEIYRKEEEPIGFEINEDVVEMAPGISEPFSADVSIETSTTTFEKIRDDGCWEKRTIRKDRVGFSQQPPADVFVEGAKITSDILLNQEIKPSPQLPAVEKPAEELEFSFKTMKEDQKVPVDESFDEKLTLLDERGFQEKGDDWLSGGDDEDYDALERLAPDGSLLRHKSSVSSDNEGIKVFSETVEGDPKIETEVKETEEVLPDGTVVKRRQITQTEKKAITTHVILEGPEGDLPEAVAKYESDLKPEIKTETEILDDGTVVQRTITTTTEEIDSNIPKEEHYREESYPHDESMATGSKDLEAARIAQAFPMESAECTDEAHAEGATESASLHLRKQVSRRTVIKDGKEETVVTEDTHIEQEREPPEELQQPVKEIISEFMETHHDI